MLMDRTSARVFDVPALRRVFDDSATNVRARILTMYLLLGGANIGAWVLALAAFHTRPALIATAVLAYTFGLRHAVDAGKQAAGRGRFLLFARPFNDRRGALCGDSISCDGHPAYLSDDGERGWSDRDLYFRTFPLPDRGDQSRGAVRSDPYVPRRS